LVSVIISHSAGPESLEGYFQKGGTKSLVHRCQAKFATVPEHLKNCHIYFFFGCDEVFS